MQEYQIQKSIGIGSFGQVFLARQVKTGKVFVIKKIKIKDINPKDKENIETEIELLRDLKHINIVSYKDSFIDNEGVLNIVMQNCEEGDMYHRIRGTNGRKFEQQQILDWTIQMCLAIYHMHDRRILHRDLKTQNIFLTNGRIRLGDFGISKVLDSTVQLTSTVIGTPYYMSPEQFKYKPYSYKTDIWALGCVIYEMCSLRHAFDAQSLNALAVKVLKGNYPPLSSNYSKGLRELVGKMLSVNPKDRPTVVQVLKSQVLRKRLTMYIQECIKQEHSDDNHIESLILQAQKLGIPLSESEPSSSFNSAPKQPAPGAHPNPTPAQISNSVPVHTSQSLQHEAARGSSREHARSINRSDSQEKLQEKRISAANKRHLEEENRKSKEREVIQKRNELLEREKEKRKRLVSQERLKRNSSSERKLPRDESLPLLNQTDAHKRKIEPIVASSSRPKTRLPEIPTHSGGGFSQPLITPPPSSVSQTPQPSISGVQTPKNKSFTKQNQKKPFRMEEEYDMDFEEESEEEKAEVIEEAAQEEDREHEVAKKYVSEPPQKIVVLEEKKVEEKKVKVVSKAENNSQNQPQPQQKTVKQEEKNAPTSQNTNINSSGNRVAQIKQISKSIAVQQVSPPSPDSPKRKPVNPTRTELQYSHSSISDIGLTDFISKQTSADQSMPIKKLPNPKYIHVEQRIHFLKERVEGTIGEGNYSKLYNLVKSMPNADALTLKNKVLDIIEHKNLADWHLVDQIIELETVLKVIPQFVR